MLLLWRTRPGFVTQRAVWPDFVVVTHPAADRAPGIHHIAEPILVEAAVSELTVKAFHERILGGLARLDKVQLYTGIARPEERRFAGKLRTIVTNDRPGQWPGQRQLVQVAAQPQPGD